MAKILLVYQSESGNTQAMAEAVAEGVRTTDVEVEVKPLDQARVEDLPDYDGIILGTPTYFASMTAEVKRFVDDSIKVFKQLEGKVGAAFSSSGDLGGGSESAVIDVLRVFLVHGMVVPGFCTGGHYGPVSVGAPDEERKAACRAMGARVALLVSRLAEN